MSPFCEYKADIRICGLLSGKNTGNSSIIGQSSFKIIAPCPINTGMCRILLKIKIREKQGIKYKLDYRYIRPQHTTNQNLDMA
jgi:hypothetical protein